MKALILQDYMQLEYRDVPMPEPGPGEVLVRRLLRRQRLYEAHRTHAYQFAARKLGERAR